MAAGEALRFIPLVKAGWAHASRIERVPLIAADARPFVLLAGRPAAEWTANARTGWFTVAFDVSIRHQRVGVTARRDILGMSVACLNRAVIVRYA